MNDFFIANFYWIDFTIAVLILAIVILLYKFEKIDKYFWYLYWLGVLIGLTWELPMSIANDMGIYPPAHFITPLPTHFSVIVITHSLWDGGLFLFGAWLVLKLCRKPQFEKFRFQELLVMLIWGQLSELSVELISTFSNAWEYIEYWWNPVLFVFNGHNITLLPQLIWFAAPIVFYIIAIKIKKKLADKN
ncbi:MAG: hypothetical protein ACTSR7_19220 [Promethearchaeota archaeon]